MKLHITTTLALTLTLIAAAPISAATFTWDGGAGDGVWQTGASVNNWSPNGYAPGNGGDNSFVFTTAGYGGTTSISLQGGHNPNVNNLSLNGNASTLTFTINNTTAGTHLDLKPLANGSETITVASGANNYTINAVSGGEIQLFAFANQNWNIGTSATLTINALIQDLAFTRGFTKTGDGTLTLGNIANTYTGATAINDGTLTLAFNSTSTTFVSPITVSPGATLRYSATTNSEIDSTAATVDLQGALVYNVTGNTFQVTQGAVTANAASTIDVTAGGVTAAGLYLDGGLYGSSAITVTSHTDGVGLVLRRLTPASTYSGIMTVNGTASAAFGTGSGLVLGNTGATLASADLTINGTLELGDHDLGQGWALVDGVINGTTAQIDALAGSGVVVANFNASGRTRTLSVGNNNGSGSFSGVIAVGTNSTLSFTKTGTGTQTLSGASANTANGVVFVNNGELHLGKTAGVNALGGTGIYVGDNLAGAAKVKLLAANQLPNAFDLNVDPDGTFDMNGYSEEISSLWYGFSGFGGSVTSTAGAPTLTLNLGGDFNGTVDGTLSLVMNGTLQDLHGINTYTGNTTVSGGSLRLWHGVSNNTIANSPVIHVAAGATLNVQNLAGSVDLNLANGQVLKGSGTVVGNLTVAGGATISPGNSPGTLLHDGDETWDDNSNYTFEIDDATGTAGAMPGWDLLDIDGSLTLDTTHNVDIVSHLLGGGDVSGDIANFNAYASYAWMFVDTTSAIGTYVDANQFVVDTTQFTNDTTGGIADGYFEVLRGDNPLVMALAPGSDNTQLYLYYYAALPTPEPSTLALALASLAGLGLCSRRRSA